MYLLALPQRLKIKLIPPDLYKNFFRRTEFIEGKTEEDFDMKNHFIIKNLEDPISNREAASKNFVDNL